MSGFSPEWLALREPADHAARDAGLVAALARALAARPGPVRILDLGCGTGSNLRGLSALLPGPQHWTLIDHDPALLAVARDRLTAWADHAATERGELVLTRDARVLRVVLRVADLAAGLDGPLAEHPAPDLVTAAALFDLVSTDWIERAAAAVARAGALFYTALTFDGAETWTPPHPDDAAVHAAFLAHQGSDKGFGPAAGPAATAALAAAFGEHGYRVAQADSPWRIGAGPLLDSLAGGKASAAAETGLVSTDRVDAWRRDRSAGATAAVIGHRDLLALPPAGTAPPATA
ncbi:class I SAM-dependent methyltransferase [Methylobacterium sp. JK268]